MQKIVPFLWFDTQAEEAVALYTSVFPHGRTTNVVRYGDAGPGPKGAVMTVSFAIGGCEMTALNGGPEYAFSPAISFFVRCGTEAEVDRIWEKLADGGTPLMELGSYPFNGRYGWIQDRFGLSWQIGHYPGNAGIVPALLFVGARYGYAEEAIGVYTSLFDGSAVGRIERHAAGSGEREGTIAFASFTVAGQELNAMESGYDHRFTFTPAVSFYVDCASQDEVDRYWNALTRGGKGVACGWLEDRFGVSWQIVPAILPEYLADPDPVKSQRVMASMLKMVKLDIAELTRAHSAR